MFSYVLCAYFLVHYVMFLLFYVHTSSGEKKHNRKKKLKKERGRLVHEPKDRGFTVRLGPLVTPRNRRARSDHSGTKFFGLTKPRIICTGMDLEWNWKRKKWGRIGLTHNPKHTTSSITHGGGSVTAIFSCIIIIVSVFVSLTV